MRAQFVGRIEACLKSLMRRKPRYSAAFERFRISFIADGGCPREGLDSAALLRLQDGERERAERMLLEALPDLRAVIGLGTLRSSRARRRLLAIFELECAAAQAARIAGDRSWRADALIASAQALWRIDPGPRYSRALIGTLECAPTWAERMDAAMALTEMPSPEVEDALVEALDDRDALVRHHAARALLAIHGVEFDVRAINHMVYRVMANDPERREEGRRDVIAVLERDPPPSAPVRLGRGAV